MALTTALGYLGRWEPLLQHLGPGEPWMHAAAHNVFWHWIPNPPEGASERERAPAWIQARLTDPNLTPAVRDTLGQLRETLAQSLGHY